MTPMMQIAAEVLQKSSIDLAAAEKQFLAAQQAYRDAIKGFSELSAREAEGELEMRNTPPQPQAADRELEKPLEVQLVKVEAEPAAPMRGRGRRRRGQRA